jgi:hypothetical protein
VLSPSAKLLFDSGYTGHSMREASAARGPHSASPLRPPACGGDCAAAWRGPPWVTRRQHPLSSRRSPDRPLDIQIGR